MHNTRELSQLMDKIESSFTSWIASDEESTTPDYKKNCDALVEKHGLNISLFLTTYGTDIKNENNAEHLNEIKGYSFLIERMCPLTGAEKETLYTILPYFTVFYKRMKNLIRKDDFLKNDSMIRFSRNPGVVKRDPNYSISELPREIATSPSVISLECTDTLLSHLPDCTYLPNLRSLNVSGCAGFKFVVRDPELRLPALEELDISGTQIDINTLPLYLKNIALKTQLRKQWRRLRDSEFGEGCVGTAFLIAIFVPLILPIKPTSVSGRLIMETSKMPAKFFINICKLSFWHLPRLIYKSN